MYIPPFTVTDEITSLIADIAEKVGLLSATSEHMPAPHLRKENRIKTIQSSLAIENNSLSVDQVTAIVEGKRVLGPPSEIQEVKNAIDAYELLLDLFAMCACVIIAEDDYFLYALIPAVMILILNLREIKQVLVRIIKKERGRAAD